MCVAAALTLLVSGASADTSSAGWQTNDFSSLERADVSCPVGGSCMAIGLSPDGGPSTPYVLSGSTWTALTAPSDFAEVTCQIDNGDCIVGTEPGDLANNAPVSCATALHCVVLGSDGDGGTLAWTWAPSSIGEGNSPGAWSSQEIGGFSDLSLSCPTTSFCVALGTANTESAPVIGAPSGSSIAYTLSDGSWSSTQLPDIAEEGQVSCPAANECVAVGLSSSGALVADEDVPQVGWSEMSSEPPAITIGGTGGYGPIVGGLSCNVGSSPGGGGVSNAFSCGLAAQTFQAGGDYTGQNYGVLDTLSGGSWSEAPLVGSASTWETFMTGVSCPTAGYCMATGEANTGVGPNCSPPRPEEPAMNCFTPEYTPFVYEYSGGAWSEDGSVPLPPEGPGDNDSNGQAGPRADAVSCASANSCVVADSDDQYYNAPTNGGPEMVGSPGDDTVGLETESAPTYKLILYTTAASGQFYPLGHGFVQLREYSPSAEPTGDCTAAGVSCQTYGEYPGKPSSPGSGNCVGSFLANGFGDTSGCITSGDANSAWGWRIVYEVSKQQYNDAISYVDSQLTAQSQGTLVYSLLEHNCLAFAVAVANAAGLTVPEYKLNGTTPDPRTLANSLAAVGTGNSIDDGTAQVTDGSTASGAPDPTMPEDPSSVTDVAAAALNDPSELASTLGFGLDSITLPAATVGTSGMLDLEGTGSLPDEAVYAINWGDGSATDIGVASSLNPGFTPSFSHTYASPGNYSVQMVVLDGAVEDYTLQVTVSSGSGSATAPFAVATPPTSWDYPYTYTEAAYGPLAGSPAAPTIDTVAAGVDSATIAFSPPEDPGESPITGYAVTATDTTNLANGGQTATATGSPITVTGLTPGDSYTFTVTATNSEGPGTPSAASTPVTPTAASGAPGGGTGGGGSGGGSGAGGGRSNTTTSSAGSSNTSGSQSTTSRAATKTALGGPKLKSAKVTGEVAKLVLGCSGTASCQITLKLSVVETVRKGKPIAIAAVRSGSAKAKTTKRTIALAQVTLTLEAGASRTVTLMLSAAGRRLLNQRKRMSSKLTVERTVSGHTTVVATRTLSFKS